MVDVPVPRFRKCWTQTLASLNSQSHAITKKYPKAGYVALQVHKIPKKIGMIARCKPDKVRGSP
jgi:hypothetical protein